MRYYAYGLCFASDFALPELSAALPVPASESHAAPDVVIELGSAITLDFVRSVTAEGAPLENSLDFSARRAQLLYSGVGRFTITDGRHILVEPLEETGASTWRLPLLGSVLALLLEQRGMFVLHAGAVDMGDFAAAFLGEKGQGKSTLNAALSCAGYPLLNDDVVALTWPGAPKTGFPIVLPGFAQIKLVPDAVRAVLGSDPADYPSVAPELSEFFEKRSFQAPLATNALPLHHLLVLSSLDADDSGEDVRLRPLSPQEALIQLIPHTFAARFGELYLKEERKKNHFRHCARLVSECQVWELARRRDLTLLPATIDAIARALGASPSQTVRL